MWTRKVAVAERRLAMSSPVRGLRDLRSYSAAIVSTGLGPPGSASFPGVGLASAGIHLVALLFRLRAAQWVGRCFARPESVGVTVESYQLRQRAGTFQTE